MKTTASSIATEPTADPYKFGFRVTSIAPELCCSDVPGKPTPTGETTVEGLTPDNERFLLSCLPVSYRYYAANGKISGAARDEWYQMHTASIKHGKYEDSLTIYNSDPDPTLGWKTFAECSVINEIDQAQNEFPIRVYSSSAANWKGGSGYEVKATANTESLVLRCLNNAQSTCMSIAPAVYRAIRDGSEVRICDSDLKVIAKFQIQSEAAP